MWEQPSIARALALMYKVCKGLKMEILVKDLVAECNYALGTFEKILTKNGISNHFMLNREDLEKLYQNLEVKNHKSFSLRLALDDILNKSA